MCVWWIFKASLVLCRSSWTPCTATSPGFMWFMWIPARTARNTQRRITKRLFLKKPASRRSRRTRTTGWAAPSVFASIPYDHLIESRLDFIDAAGTTITNQSPRLGHFNLLMIVIQVLLASSGAYSCVIFSASSIASVQIHKLGHRRLFRAI